MIKRIKNQTALLYCPENCLEYARKVEMQKLHTEKLEPFSWMWIQTKLIIPKRREMGKEKGEKNLICYVKKKKKVFKVIPD